MVSEPGGRGRVIFVPDRGPVAPVWGAWSELFDANGYDPTVLVGDDIRSVAAQLDSASEGRPPVVVGHGTGAHLAVAAVLVVGSPGRDRPSPSARRSQGEAAHRRGMPAAAVAISPSRRSAPSWTLGRVAPRGLGPFLSRRHRPPGVPIVLVGGGAEPARAQRATVRLERQLRGAGPAEVTDRQILPGLSGDLPLGDSWRDAADFVLDWLTRQDL